MTAVQCTLITGCSDSAAAGCLSVIRRTETPGEMELSMTSQEHVLIVVRGRIVAASQVPVNGQQLMMQVDNMTSAMTDMMVTSSEEKMDTDTGGQEYLLQNLGQQNQHQEHLKHLKICQQELQHQEQNEEGGCQK